MKKRFIFGIIILALFCVLFLIYSRYQYREKSIAEAANLKNNDITKIVIIPDVNLKRTVSIENKQKINEFLTLMNSIIIKKEIIHQTSNGPGYGIEFFSNEKLLKNMRLNIAVMIDRRYYKIIKGDLTQNIIDLVKLADSSQ